MSEDPSIEDEAERKAALRAQVATAGEDAAAVFAAEAADCVTVGSARPPYRDGRTSDSGVWGWARGGRGGTLD